MDEDVTYTCPHCWQEITARLDLSAGSQTYVQDCEVCCNPLEFTFSVVDGQLLDFDVQPLDQ